MKEIKHFTRSQIDPDRWNAAIEKSNITHPYALSWYLDVVAPGWEALIQGDYETVMPLPIGRKLGVKFIYQPYYCQQLGLFGTNIEHEAYSMFCNRMQEIAPYIDYNFNYKTPQLEPLLKQRSNFVLSLEAGFTMLKNGFSSNLVRNAKKAFKAGLEVKECDLASFLTFYTANNAKKEKLKDKHALIVQQLWDVLNQKQMVSIQGAYSAGGILQAATFLVMYKSRVINLINTSNPEGRKEGANHLLLSSAIESRANNNRIFDFEGSTVPGVRSFYLSFGPQDEPYANLKTNILRTIRQRLHR